jgi:hypothetical protein
MSKDHKFDQSQFRWRCDTGDFEQSTVPKFPLAMYHSKEEADEKPAATAASISKKRKFDISRFSGPGEFRKAVPFVSTSFCHATLKIMEKYHLAFDQACELLEKAEYLDWADTTPIYNLEGDKLWMKDVEEKPLIITAPIEDPVSIYTLDAEISCVFFTLAIRNEALDAKYRGGHEAFVGRYFSKYNDDIAVLIAMDTEDLEEAVADIINQGLVRGVDFHTFDATIIDFIEAEDEVVDKNIDDYYFRVDTLPWDVRAEWLQACIHDGSTYVSRVNDKDI